MTASTQTPSSMSLEEIYAQNSCGFTRGEWADMHRRTGYTLGNVPPCDYETALLGRCAPEVSAFAGELSEGGKPLGLLITGLTGRGKTYAACAVMRAVSDSMSVGLATDAEMVRDAKAAIGGRVTEAAVVERYCAPSLLVIDDLGKAAYTRWASQLVFEVIDRRMRRKRPTVITTQYDARGIVTRLTVDGDSATGESVISRMRQFRSVSLGGADRRRA